MVQSINIAEEKCQSAGKYDVVSVIMFKTEEMSERGLRTERTAVLDRSSIRTLRVTNKEKHINDGCLLERQIGDDENSNGPSATETASIYKDKVVSEFTQRYTKVVDDWEKFTNTMYNWTLFNYGSYIFCQPCGRNVSDVEFTYWTDRFVSSLGRLITETENNYVPFFGYSITYLIVLAVVGVCDSEMSIWVQNSDQATRLLRMDQAFIVCLILLILILNHRTWSPISLFGLANIIILSEFLTKLWLFMVYGYMPSCAPLLPFPLVEDLTEWIFTRIAPGCFCTLFPAITQTLPDCQPSTCHACVAKDFESSRYQTVQKFDFITQQNEDVTIIRPWYNCTESIPIVSELGIWWNWVFALRWGIPSSISWLAETDIIPEDLEATKQLVFEAWQMPNDVSTNYIDCFKITILNLPLTALIGFVVAYIVIKLTIVVILFFIDFILWLWQLVLLLTLMATGIEQTGNE